MDLTELQKEAHAIARDHGWWDQERSFGDLIALVHSELSEALEAYRDYGNTTNAWMELVDEDSDRIPVGVGHELADVVIRVADMAEHYGERLEPYVEEIDSWPGLLAYEGLATSFGEWIDVMHMALSDVSRSWHVLKDHCLWVDHLARFVALAQRMAAHYGIDLDAAIEAKMAFNRTREYRHGGKAL